MSVRVCCLDWSVVPGGMGWWLGMTRWVQNGEMERDSERERERGRGSRGAGRREEHGDSRSLPLACPSLAVNDKSTRAHFRRKQMPPYRLLTYSADLEEPRLARLLLAIRYSPLDIYLSLHIDQELRRWRTEICCDLYQFF